MVKKILALAFLGIITFLASAQNSQAACPGPEFLNSPYKTGDTVRLRGGSSIAPWVMCLYNPSGNLANYTTNQSATGTITISYTANTVGTWTGVVLTGSELVSSPTSSSSCPSSIASRSIACSVTTNITASTTTPTTPTTPTEPTTPTTPTTGGYKCVGSNGAENASGIYYCDDLCDKENACSSSPCPSSGTIFCSTPEETCSCSSTTPTTPTTPTAPTEPTETTASAATGGSYTNPLPGIHTLTEAATVMIQAILGLIGTIALLFLIIAGIMYITAAGEEEKIKAAKRIITGTIVGLGIALLAFSFLQVIVDILG